MLGNDFQYFLIFPYAKVRIDTKTIFSNVLSFLTLIKKIQEEIKMKYKKNNKIMIQKSPKMLHPVLTAINPSVFVCSCVKTGIFVHSGVNQMIGEFSTDTLLFLRRNHCGLLSDLFGSGLVHGFGQALLEFDVLLGLLVLTHKGKL
jgi:hypothetical protein